jgi:hypothetical protein
MAKAGVANTRGIIAQLAKQGGSTKQPAQIEVENNFSIVDSKAVLVDERAIGQYHLCGGYSRNVRG